MQISDCNIVTRSRLTIIRSPGRKLYIHASSNKGMAILMDAENCCLHITKNQSAQTINNDYTMMCCIANGKAIENLFKCNSLLNDDVDEQGSFIYYANANYFIPSHVISRKCWKMACVVSKHLCSNKIV